ncbi:MAG: hypothetical protein Tsb0021_18090 [Chlamydiales bacterium]
MAKKETKPISKKEKTTETTRQVKSQKSLPLKHSKVLTAEGWKRRLAAYFKENL